MRCSIDSEAPASWTGRQRSWMRRASGQKGGISDRSQSGRPRQEGVEDPRPVRSRGNSAGRRRLGREHPRQHHAAPDGRGNSRGQVPPWTATTQTGSPARRQGVRLRRSPLLAARAPDRAADRSPRHRPQRSSRPAPVEDRTHPRLAHRLPKAHDPLRTTCRTLRRFPPACRGHHLFQETLHVRHALMPKHPKSAREPC